MNPKVKTALNLVSIAIGTFSVATLSNMSAQHLSSDNKEHKRKGMIYASSGVVISIGMLYWLNSKKIKNGGI